MPKPITKKHFQTLILIDLGVSVFAAIIQPFVQHFLSPEWQALIATEEAVPAGSHYVWVFTIGVVLLIGLWSLENLYALYHFKPYARKHLLILTIIYFASSLMGGFIPSVVTGFDSAFLFFTTVCRGLEIALVYYSPLAQEFEPQSEQPS